MSKREKKESDYDGRRERRLGAVTIVLVGIVCFGCMVVLLCPGMFGVAETDMQFTWDYFDPSRVTEVDISLDEETWNHLLEHAMDEEYYEADITLNGDRYSKVGIRVKGENSLDGVYRRGLKRFGFKVKANAYIPGQTFHGLSEFVLNNGYNDASYMREYLSYSIFEKMGVPTPEFAYAAVYLNGNYIGLYLMVECIEEEFIQRNFGAGNGQLYKPERLENSGVYGGGRDLVYVGDSTLNYPQIFENAVFSPVTDEDKKRVVESLKSLKYREKIEEHIDVDEVLRYFAVNTSLVNLDSYIQRNPHNYYLYERGGKLSMIPWDLNLSFGGYKSGGGKVLTDFPVDTPYSSGLSADERPMITGLLLDDGYKERYHFYLREIATKYLGDAMSEEIDRIDALIRSYVRTDPTSLVTFEEYQAGVEKLREFGKERAVSILEQLDGKRPSVWEVADS